MPQLGTSPENRLPAVQLSAIILAGGKSSRMGRDKALIPIQGMPLLAKVCQAAVAIAPAIYIVTPWPERYQNLVPSKCEFIAEPPGSRGPTIGFARGLKAVKTEWVLLLACDLPLLSGTAIQAWLPLLATANEEAIALVPRSSKGWEPLCGFYRRQCLTSLNEFIANGGSSFQAWLAQNCVQELPLDNSQILFNCNTPADLEQLFDWQSESTSSPRVAIAPE